MTHRWRHGAAVIALLAGASHASERVACLIDYGGETRRVEATPSANPYEVKPIKIGSYFLFRLVLQTPPHPHPAVRIFVYADRDDGPVPLQVAEYPWPPGNGSRKPGFTGWQSVYEPVRDGELQYWCRRGR